MYTRKEFMKFCDLEKKTAKFSVTVTFIELLNAHGLQDLKSVSVINSVEDGFMFNNIRYSAVAMPKPNFITLEVEIPDISQWLIGNPIKAMIKAQQKQAKAKALRKSPGFINKNQKNSELV